MSRYRLVLPLLMLICGVAVWVMSQPNALIVAQTIPEPTALPLYALPNANLNRAYTSSTMALSAIDSRTLIAVNMLNNSVTIAVPSQSRLVTEIPVGRDPRSVVLSPDANRAVVANRADHTLSVINMNTQRVSATIPLNGYYPYGIVTEDGNLIYVALEGSSQIAVVDVNAGAVLYTIPVGQFPTGLALWGEFLYVTHLWSGDLSLIYLPQRRVIQTLETGSDTALFQSIELDISRGLAYLPQTRLNAQNPQLTYDSTAYPVVNVVNLQGLSVNTSQRIALDTADRPVNMPFALALDRFAQRLYVANAGTNNVSVIDINTGVARANLPVGANPRGIMLNRDNTLLFVHNMLDASITIFNTNTLIELDTLQLTRITLPIDQLLGAQLFHSAEDPRMSNSGWLSCATCHFEGYSDGNTWVGFPNGPSNTSTLFALPETVPYTWLGRWHDLAGIEEKIRWLQGGEGLILDQDLNGVLQPRIDLSLDLEVLTAYLNALPTPVPAPILNPDLFAEGQAVFDAQGCASCHVGTIGTNLQAVDVGTSNGVNIDTPTLRYLNDSAPYFHDGAAETLADVFRLEGTHQLIYSVSPEQIEALIYYLNHWSSIPLD